MNAAEVKNRLNLTKRVQDLTLGDYLRWLATTFGPREAVKAELVERAKAADALQAALEELTAAVDDDARQSGRTMYKREIEAREAARAAIAKATP